MKAMSKQFLFCHYITFLASAISRFSPVLPTNIFIVSIFANPGKHTRTSTPETIMNFLKIFAPSPSSHTNVQMALSTKSQVAVGDPPPYPASSQDHRRFVNPFLAETKKPLTVLTHNNLMVQPRLRREEFTGNPVFIDSIKPGPFKKCQHHPYVTGDIASRITMTVTV